MAIDVKSITKDIASLKEQVLKLSCDLEDHSKNSQASQAAILAEIAELKANSEKTEDEHSKELEDLRVYNAEIKGKIDVFDKLEKSIAELNKTITDLSEKMSDTKERAGKGEWAFKIIMWGVAAFIVVFITTLAVWFINGGARGSADKTPTEIASPIH